MTTTDPTDQPPTRRAEEEALTTSAMIASFADPGQKTAQRPVRARPRASWPQERPEIVGLSADLAKYTDMHIFRDAHPDRFFQMGMAEQAMLGAAAGLAEVGLVPFASTYSVFATRRAYDFLCLDIAEPNLNVNIVGALPGLTTGYGPSHQATEDLAILRGCPNLTIVDPCDSVDIEQAVPQLADHPGPTYLRLLRGAVPTVLDEYGYRFQLGKAAELRTGRDVVLISTGLMTMRALQAAARLEADHVDVAVLHVPDDQAAGHARRSCARPAPTGSSSPWRTTPSSAGSPSRSPRPSPSPASAPASSRSRCPTSSSPPAPCPPCTTATACRPTPSSARSRPSSDGATPRSWPPTRPRPPSDTRCTDQRRRPMSISDKTAVVTGAGSTRGIGRATAHALAAAGWNIAILDLDEAGAKDAADEIAERHGVQAVGVGCDVTDEASVEAALAVARRRRCRRSARWSTTPASPRRPRSSRSPARSGTASSPSTCAAPTTSPAASRPGMAERGFGRIVFLSSVSAERGGGVFGGVAYSAAKAAQLGFARALARELGPQRRHGQLRRPRSDRHRHHRRRPGGRAQDAAPRRHPGRPQRQRRRRRRPHHLPVPRGVRLHHRRHLRRQRRRRTSTDQIRPLRPCLRTSKGASGLLLHVDEQASPLSSRLEVPGREARRSQSSGAVVRPWQIRSPARAQSSR